MDDSQIARLKNPNCKSAHQPPQAAAQTAELPESGEGTGGNADRTSPHCLSESEFAGACAEQGEKSRRACVCAAAVGCRAGTARVLFFCERFLLHTKRKCSRITMNFIFTAAWKTSAHSRFSRFQAFARRKNRSKNNHQSP